MELFPLIVTVAVCYLLGNHNGAICVSNMLGDDVRSHGSGNAGLTNFIRSYGAGRSALVIVIDVGKAVLACLIAGMVFAPYGMELEGRVIGGVAVMLGHDFPALQGFRGGKGILSGWFIAWVVDWRVGLAIIIIFALTYVLTRYVSLASVLAAVTFAVAFLVFHHDNVIVMSGGVFMSLLAIYMHRSNIARLIKGQESKTNLFGKGNVK